MEGKMAKKTLFDWKLKTAIIAIVIAILAVVWGALKKPSEKIIDNTDYKKISYLETQISQLKKEARNVQTVEEYYQGVLLKRTTTDLSKIDTGTDTKTKDKVDESLKDKKLTITYQDHLYLGISGANIPGSDDLLGPCLAYSTGSALFVFSYYRDFDYSQPFNVSRLTMPWRETFSANAMIRIF